MCYEVEPVKETVVLLDACVGSSFDNARACACNVLYVVFPGSYGQARGKSGCRLSVNTLYVLYITRWRLSSGMSIPRVSGKCIAGGLQLRLLRMVRTVGMARRSWAHHSGPGERG